MGDFAQNVGAVQGAKAATVGGFEAVGVVALQEVTAVFSNGRNALEHLVIRYKWVLGQHNVANLGRVALVDGRIDQNRFAFSQGGVHGTAVDPAALPARTQ